LEREIVKFRNHPLLVSLNKEDLDELRILIQKVQDTGIAYAINFTKINSRKTYFRVELSPEFDSSGKVNKIIINSFPITKSTFENSISDSETNNINSAFENFCAVATYDYKLNLKDYFTSSNKKYNEVFSRPKSLKIINKWLKNLIEDTQNSNLLIPKTETGHIGLNLNLVGKNENTDTICIRIESSEEFSFSDDLFRFNQLKKTILNTIPANIAIWDLNHRYIFLNKNACQNDLVREWFTGKNDFEFCTYRNKPIDIAIKRRMAFNKMLLSGKQVSIEEEMDSSEGKEFHLRIFQPILNTKGQVQFGLGYGLDITSIKQIESNLTKMSFAVKEAMDGIGVLDATGNYIYINEAHIKMFGYQSEKDFIGKSWHMLYQNEEIEYLEKKVFPEIIKNGRWAGLTKGKLKNGEVVYQEITLTGLPDGGLICICRDKTKERINEQRLERASIVADNTTSVIIVTDPQVRIQWVNKAFTTVTGYSLEEVIGKDPTFLHGPETDEKESNKIFKRLLSKKGFSAEILNYSKSGKKYWMQINTTPIFNEENELINFVSVENDITQLKQAQESIINNLQKEKELNELKSQFVSIASHEIRTPLASIQSSSDLIKLFLEKDVIPKEKIESHLVKIENQISRLSTIMANLLTVGRINLGKFDLHRNETDIEAFIKNIINEFFTVTSDGRNIIFKVSGNKKKSQIDKVLMSQVMINLISNAIKYSVGKSDPEVILNYEAKYFTIQVIDYGIGIPENQQKNIFSSFFRAENVENIQGTGLGLVIVKKFVEMHKGKISFTSILNKGACFVVKFPYQ
jgi:PAS domain S-box-containing protein